MELEKLEKSTGSRFYRLAAYAEAALQTTATIPVPYRETGIISAVYAGGVLVLLPPATGMTFLAIKRTNIFAYDAWPTTSAHQQWGTGNGSGDGKYRKSLGEWNNGNPVYPKLWFED